MVSWSSSYGGETTVIPLAFLVGRSLLTSLYMSSWRCVASSSFRSAFFFQVRSLQCNVYMCCMSGAALQPW